MEDETYQFTSDWFSGNVSPWRNVLAQTGVKPKRVLEIGAYEGRSTVWIIEEFQPTFLATVDDWSGQDSAAKEIMTGVEQRFDNNIKLACQKSPGVNVEKLSGKSSVMLAALLSRQIELFDLVYVDGDHRTPGVLSDLIMAFHLCRVGGLIFCDDYLWNLQKGLVDTPKLAIDSFVNCYRFKVRIIPERFYQLYLQKVAD